MKVWNGYGSEHSMNLVMIGQFQSVDEARNTKDLIETVTESIHDLVDASFDNRPTRFPEEVMEVLREHNLFLFAPEELEQFRYDTSLTLDGNKLIFKTDESDVSAFLKILLHKGAKIEAYSAHDYPDEQYGRGK